MAMYFLYLLEKEEDKYESNEAHWNKTNGNDGYS
jgi:hypothetical protein